MSRIEGPRSLLERASEAFDLTGAFRGKSLPPLDIPDYLIPSAEDAEADRRPRIPDADDPVRSAPDPQPKPPRAPDFAGPHHPVDRIRLAELGFANPDGPISALGEEFAAVRRELLGRMRGGRNQAALAGGNIILFTSAHEGDGKTFCAVNAALALAGECEVLLIDADLMRPAVADVLGLGEQAGLTDALADPSVPPDEFVLRTDVPGLAVLTAGLVAAGDRLTSARIEALIEALSAGRPDRVLLFDSPPLLTSSAASALATHVGQAVLVVRADRTPGSAIEEAAAMLSPGCPVSLLLNGVSFAGPGRRFGSYHGSPG